jgi:hypothetical protein
VQHQLRGRAPLQQLHHIIKISNRLSRIRHSKHPASPTLTTLNANPDLIILLSVVNPIKHLIVAEVLEKLVIETITAEKTGPKPLLGLDGLAVDFNRVDLGAFFRLDDLDVFDADDLGFDFRKIGNRCHITGSC